MNWTDALPTMPDFPSLFEPEPRAEPTRAGFHVRRTGVGVFSACYLREPKRDGRYAAFRNWKADPIGQAEFLDSAAGAIVALVRAWSPVLPSDWIVTVPPAGVSEGSIYPAGVLGREVATRLSLDFLSTLQRSGPKRRGHHPRESLQQEPYREAVVPPSVALVVDDFLSSGTTMRLSRAALAAVGAPSFGFSWGCD